MPRGHKGEPKVKGSGRTKGTPNKATINAREAIAAFVDGNAHRLVGWLDQIALDNPKDAFNCFQSVIEYHIPKLARTDSTVEAKLIGDKDHPIMVSVKRALSVGTLKMLESDLQDAVDGEAE